MRLTYSIKAHIRTDKKKADGICPIYFFLRVGAHVAKIPSGKNINPNDWDNKNKCPKKTTKHGQLLATYLNQKISGFDTFMLTQQTLNRPITSFIAASYFKNNCEVTLFKFWEDQMALWEHTYSVNTLKSYRSVLKILKEFNPKINFGDISPVMIDLFDKYLCDIRHNTINGRFAKHKNLKSIINQAIRKGYLKENPYKSFKIRSDSVNRKFLSIEEVKHLMNMEIPEDMPMLYKVRDIFLFSCFTGLRFSDVMSLKVANIKVDKGQYRLEFTVNKTNRALMIPLSADGLRLIGIYTPITSKNQGELIFPPIANPVINKNLKKLMIVAGIDKWISFHCARHSFASNHVEIGTSIVYIKELLGHRNLDQTQIYAKANKNDLFKPMSKLYNMYQ